MLTAALFCPPAIATDLTSYLIENARIVDRKGIVEDTLVNILIIDHTLDVVTKDEGRLLLAKTGAKEPIRSEYHCHWADRIEM